MTRKLRQPDNIIAGRRRGNTTEGAARRGNRNGRTPIYQGGATWPLSVTLSDEHFAKALYAGSGIAGRGIRELLDKYTAPTDAVLERGKAEEHFKIHKDRIAKASRAAAYSARKAAKTRALIAEHMREPVDPECAVQPNEEWDDHGTYIATVRP